MSLMMVNPYRFGGDPFFSSVVLMFSGEGTNGSTTFTDLTGRHTISPNSVVVSTADASFPNGAASFDALNDYLDFVNNGGDFNFGTGDFTVETYIELKTGGESRNAIFSNYNGAVSTGMMCSLTGVTGSGFTGLEVRSGDANVYGKAFTGSLDTRYHMAWSRVGNSMYTFVDGTQVGTTSSVTGVSFGRTAGSGNLINSTFCGVGYPGGLLYSFRGLISWMRVTKGVGRYSANFTPPTVPLPTA